MGLDFIRSLATKPWRKKWDAGVDVLKQPTLFDLQFAAAEYTVTMDCVCPTKLSLGAEYVVEVDRDRLIVKESHQVIGMVDHPSPAVLDGLRARACVGIGTLKRFGTFPGTAELGVR